MPETVSTQVVARDRHAAYFSTLALIAAAIERLATEIRHCSGPSPSEAEEPLLGRPKRILGHAA